VAFAAEAAAGFVDTEPPVITLDLEEIVESQFERTCDVLTDDAKSCPEAHENPLGVSVGCVWSNGRVLAIMHHGMHHGRPYGAQWVLPDGGSNGCLRLKAADQKSESFVRRMCSLSLYFCMITILPTQSHRRGKGRKAAAKREATREEQAAANKEARDSRAVVKALEKCVRQLEQAAARDSEAGQRAEQATADRATRAERKRQQTAGKRQLTGGRPRCGPGRSKQ
jgi:hypothetical protein